MITQTPGTLWEMTRYAQVIVLIGAGGKTTTLQSLTKEIHAQGKNVIGTTTTKVYPMPFKMLWKNPVLPPPLESEYPCFWYAGEEAGKTKWLGPTVDIIDQALCLRVTRSKGEVKKDESKGLLDVWIIEGDGARENKLKCWDSHEPQIPFESQCAILVIHGGLWDKILTREEIHRPEKCPGLVGKSWSGEAAAEYIMNSPVFYPSYKKLHWVVLFNEYEGVNSRYFDPTFYIKRTIECLENDLRNHFVKHLAKVQGQIIRPAHLRIASGNVKEGRLRWYDLW